jgi:hypothetical protein
MGRRCTLGLAVLLAALAAPGCFSPDKPACAFSCVVAPFGCPPGFSCGADGLCHDPSSTGLCLIEPLDGGGPDGAEAAEAAPPADGSPDQQDR